MSCALIFVIVIIDPSKQICRFSFAFELLFYFRETSSFLRLFFLLLHSILWRARFRFHNLWDFPYQTKIIITNNFVFIISSSFRSTIEEFLARVMAVRSPHKPFSFPQRIWIQIALLFDTNEGTFYMLTCYRLKGKLMSRPIFLKTWNNLCDIEMGIWITATVFARRPFVLPRILSAFFGFDCWFQNVEKKNLRWPEVPEKGQISRRCKFQTCRNFKKRLKRVWDGFRINK